jgi:uncharacterized protein with PIN domain
MEVADVEIVSEAAAGCEAVPLAEIRTVRVPVQTFVVNGVESARYADAPAVVCPHCGEPVKAFSPGARQVDVLKALSTGDESELAKSVRCPSCGKPLRFLRPLPIDAETLN